MHHQIYKTNISRHKRLRMSQDNALENFSVLFLSLDKSSKLKINQETAS